MMIMKTVLKHIVVCVSEGGGRGIDRVKERDSERERTDERRKSFSWN